MDLWEYYKKENNSEGKEPLVLKMGRGIFGPNIHGIAKGFLDSLPLPQISENYPLGLVKETLKYSLTSGKTLVVVSSICPSYETDQNGTPTYEGLEEGISANTEKHFEYLTPQIVKLKELGIPVVHFFLMADTEVDLLPFLNTLDIRPEEFTRRCETSLQEIASKTTSYYGSEIYSIEGLPPAGRFIEFFGHDAWFERYEYFRARLLSEAQNEPTGRVATSLKFDYEERRVLIHKLLGNVSKDEGIAHIARQRGQYMAFASLMRERFGKRLIVANHRTPNFKWMNDRITREPTDEKQLQSGNYLSKLPLIELDISSLPE